MMRTAFLIYVRSWPRFCVWGLLRARLANGGKAGLAKANFNLGLGVAARKAKLAKRQAGATSAANFSLGFAFGDGCARGRQTRNKLGQAHVFPAATFHITSVWSER